MAKTRKGSRSVRKSTMSIPGLRQAMNHIKEYGMKLVRTGNNLASNVDKFRKEWLRTFNKSLSVKLAKDYLSHLSKSRKTMTRKRGGASLGYAPLAYRMEPGASLPHGAYPDYVSKGFFVPQSDNIANCGKPWITDSVVPPGLGSNLVGGKRTRRRINRRGGSLLSGLSSFTFKPYMSQNPPTTYQDTMAQMNGAKPFPGGQVHETTYQYSSNPSVGIVTAPPRPYDPSTALSSF